MNVTARCGACAMSESPGGHQCSVMREGTKKSSGHDTGMTFLMVAYHDKFSDNESTVHIGR